MGMEVSPFEFTGNYLAIGTDLNSYVHRIKTSTAMHLRNYVIDSKSILNNSINLNISIK